MLFCHPSYCTMCIIYPNLVSFLFTPSLYPLCNFHLHVPVKHYESSMTIVVLNALMNDSLMRLLILRLTMLFCHSYASYCTMSTIHPDLVSFPFLHIPISPHCHFDEFFIYLNTQYGSEQQFQYTHLTMLQIAVNSSTF